MNKLKISLSFILIFLLFVAFAKGEENKTNLSASLSLSLFYIDDESNKLSRLKEFTYFSDNNISLGKFLLSADNKDYFVSLFSSKTGEQDSKTNLKIVYPSIFIGNVYYKKFPHYIDYNISTQRTKSGINLSFLLTDNSILKTSYSEEDKTGFLSSTNQIGHKTKNTEISYLTDFKEYSVGVSYKEEKLQSNILPHKVKVYTFFASNFKDKNISRNFKYENKKIESTNNNITLKEDNYKLYLSKKFKKNFKPYLIYTYTDLNNNNSNNLSLKKSKLNIGTYFKKGKNEVKVYYERQDKKFSGIQVEKQVIDKYDFNFRSKLNKNLPLRAKFSQTIRGAKGILVPNLTDLYQLPDNIKEGKVLATFIPNEKNIITAGVSTKIHNYNLPYDYGVSYQRSLNQYLSYVYLPTEKLSLNYNFLLLEWKTEGKRKLVSGIDNYNIYEYGEFHQIGANYSLGEKTNLELGYWQNISDVGDLIEINKIKEKTFSLSVNHKINKLNSISLLFKNINYNDVLSSTTSGNTNLIELKYNKKF